MDSAYEVRIQAPAKINLGLHVLRKRPDGYHDLETVFVAIDWSDTILLDHAPSLKMTCSDASLPIDHSNLCMAAANSLADLLGCSPGVSIHLLKKIPHGAGLGGGSSDAAAVLRGLCTLWDLELGNKELQNLALSIGSDVPFFLDARPSIGRRRGEVLEDSGLTCESFPYWILVVVPDLHISTVTAYARVQAEESGRPDLTALLAGDISFWKNHLINDFERRTFDLYPQLGEIKRRLYEAGAMYASMSGSGSALYGLFADPESAADVADLFDCRTWTGQALFENV